MTASNEPMNAAIQRFRSFPSEEDENRVPLGKQAKRVHIWCRFWSQK